MNLSATNTSIRVEIPFAERFRIKEVRGARWVASEKAWVFPATPHAAQLIARMLPELGEHPHLLTFLEEPPNNYRASDHLPPEFTTKLWDHQKRAIEATWNRPASMLAMEMRTGKTAVSIALASLWGCRTVLVACPLSVVGVWCAEIRAHSRLDWLVVRLDKGSVAKRAEQCREAMALAKAQKRPLIAVINMEAVWREPFGTGALNAAWDLAIVDESHRAKAPGGKLSRYLAKLSDRVPRRLALTGTPLPHSPLDAYAQYRFLDRSVFGTSFNRMKNRYAIMGGYGNHEIKGWQNTEEFSQRFHELAFECTTDEAFDLPEELDVRRTTILEPKARKVYDSMLQNFWAEVDSGEVTASNALSKLLRLQQVTSGWVKNDAGEMVQVSNSKQSLLADVLEDIPVREPLVVFVRFVKDIDAVHEVCQAQGRRAGEVSGRHKNIADDGTFPPDLDVLICQIQSGSLGINLSRASTAIFYSWGWSLGDVEQARARIRHNTQVNRLQFIHLIVEESIDDRMLGCLKNRRDFIEDVLEQGRHTNGRKEE